MKLSLVTLLTALATVFVISGCSSSSDSGVTESPEQQPEPDPSPLTARYRLTFEATWSSETHAEMFPGNPHFSPLSGAVHNQQVILWEPGQLSSVGVESMAETGSVALLGDEVNAAIAQGYAVSAIDGGGVATSPGNVAVEFDVTTDYPLITVVSMLAPSPDWFVGVHDLVLYDGQQFVTSLTRDLLLYDAGTDGGTTYTDADSDTQPRDPIGLVSDVPFQNGAPAVGRFVIEKL